MLKTHESYTDTETNLPNYFFLAVIIILSCLALIGLYLKAYYIATLHIKSVPMAPLTAINFLLISLYYMINIRSHFTPKYPYKLFSNLILFFIIFNSFNILLSHFFPNIFSIESYLISIDSKTKYLGFAVGRMSLITAFLFIFLSLSLFFYNIFCHFITKGKIKISQILLNIVSLMGIFNLLSSFILSMAYTYDLPLFYTLNIIPPAFPTSFSFFLCSLILINIIDGKSPLFAFLYKEKSSFKIIRVFIPVVLSLLVLGESITHLEIHQHPYESFYKVLTINIFFISLLFVIVLFSIHIGSVIDKKNFKLLENEKNIVYERNQLLVTLQSIGDGIIVADSVGNITMMNPNAEYLTGYSEVDAKGRSIESIFQIYDKSTQKIVENPIRKVIETNKIFETKHTVLLISKDHRHFSITLNSAPIRDHLGNILGVILVIKDMTEQERINQEIEKNSRIESLGFLASGIAHEFNNLLCGIFGHLEIIKELSKESLTMTPYIDSSLSIFNRAKALTHKLLTFSSGGGPLKKEGYLTPLLTETTLKVLANSSIDCTFNIDKDLLPLSFDPAQMEQVIENIVINAKQAILKGGEIIITGENMFIDESYRSPLAPGHYIKVTISDNGPGIAEHLLNKIFDPFFTTKSSTSGLGLSLAYTIVKKHGGTINAISKEGEGTIISIVLPALGHLSSEDLGHDINYRGNGPILIMDDEDFIIKYLYTILTHLGHEVICTYKGEEAIEAFKEALAKKTPFKVIILDLKIQKGLGGKETCDAIRKIDPHIPIVACSGYSEDPILAHPEQYGFDMALKKPYLKGDLVKMLSQIIAKS